MEDRLITALQTVAPIMLAHRSTLHWSIKPMGLALCGWNNGPKVNMLTWDYLREQEDITATLFAAIHKMLEDLK